MDSASRTWSIRSPLTAGGALLAVLAGLLVWQPWGPSSGGASVDELYRGPPPADTAVATFAGGCFWCMEPPFDRVDGVISTTSGFSGGDVESPSYDEVSRGGTGHREAVRILYDPEAVSYRTLLRIFWHNVDPTDDGGQFCDRGFQYTTAVFYHDREQRRLAEETKAALQQGSQIQHPVVTPILPAGPFYAAEDYHQDFYRKDPRQYKSYRKGCGRDARLAELWGEAAGIAGDGLQP